jgi:hypothetical protein
MTDGAQGPRRVFQSIRAPGRARHLEAMLLANGTIRITGQDVSNGVLENDEFSSYQWTWRLDAIDVPRAAAVLGGEPGEDPLEVLDRWMAANPTDPGMVLSQAGVPIQFQSRMGE